MAFPVVLDRSLQTFSSSTTHNVAMPATVNAGDLLLVIANDTNSTIAVNWNTPTGWTRILSNLYSTNGKIAQSVYVKSAAGTEGGTTVNFTTVSTATAKVYVTRIQVGTWSGDITSAGVAIASNQTGSPPPNPPSLTPSWGAADTLWLAVVAMRDTTANSGVTAPTNYGNLTYNETSSIRSLAVAERSLNAASEDPGTFPNYTEATTNNGIGVTIAIRPSEPVEITLGATYRVRGVTAPLLSTGLFQGIGNLTGAGSLSATGILTFVVASADLSGLGSMTVAGGESIVLGSADITGVGTLSAVGFADRVDGEAAITGIGTLTATGDTYFSGAAALTGLGSLSAAAELSAILGTAHLTGVGSLTVGLSGLIFVVGGDTTRRAARSRQDDGHANLNPDAVARRARINVPSTERT